MSQPASTPSFFSHRLPPRERLRKLVGELTRARHEQVLLDHAAAGLLGALLAAVAWVTTVRLLDLDLHPGAGVAGLLVLALLGALALARRRRPGELRVAIDSDIRLGLEQTLSTAWEFELRGAEPAMLERLAGQAVRAQGLPRFGERVFPLRVGLPGKLVPLAALVLLLVGVIEPRPQSAPDAPPADRVLALEGERLREHGLAMERRAQREALARSAGEARELQRLGSHMRDGLLPRVQALARLRELGTSLGEQGRLAAAQAELPPDALRDLLASQARRDRQLQALLEKLTSATLTALEVEELTGIAAELAGPLISAETLRSALQRLDEGDPAALRRLLERLSRIANAVREMEELALADEEVRRARASLGDEPEPGERRLLAVEGEPRGAEALRFAGDDAGHPGGVTARSLVYRSSPGFGDDETPAARADSRSAQDPDAAGAALRPRARAGEGDVHRAEARVLPRAGDARLDTIAIERRFSPQVEEVLSKEDVPLHQKELIRRYFHSLAAAPEAAPGGEP